jgi:Fe-S cluster assembly ATP-binding protein
VKSLSVEIENKKILNNFNFNLEKSKVYAMMGPNGSGKSTFANVLIGNSKYKILSGKILFKNKNILNLKPNVIAKKGIFVSFQFPQEIFGVSIYDFIKTVYKSIKNKDISPFEFKKLLDEKSKIISLNEDFYMRYLNKGFSGGEKKKSEILQMLVFDPELIILDEIDSGLDIDALQSISKAINYLKSQGKTILIISHYKRIFNYVVPDNVLIMSNGRIVKKGKKELIDEIEKKGYKGFD